jgi:hypothetical protein
MGVFSTPRPVPARLAPFLAGVGVVVLALPVVLAGGFSVSGWALAAVLWGAAEALGWWLSRIPTGADNLGASGIVGVGYAVRGIGAMVVLLVVAAANKEVGVTAFVVYALAYTLSLGVSLIEYFGAKPAR